MEVNLRRQIFKTINQIFLLILKLKTGLTNIVSKSTIKHQFLMSWSQIIEVNIDKKIIQEIQLLQILLTNIRAKFQQHGEIKTKMKFQ